MTHINRTERALNKVAAGDRTIARGDRGPAVEKVQRLLNRHGAHLAVDGEFGPRTEAAVKQYQLANGLRVTGRMNHETLDKIEGARVRRPDEFVDVGDKGRQVLGIERGLKKLGYDTGAVDGKYDARTAAAVAAFRHDEGLRRAHGTGMTGSLQRELRTELRRIDHAPLRERVRPTRAHTRLDAATAAAARATDANGQVGIGPGSNSRAIRNVQAHLKSAGYDPRHVDGRFDERTGAMVRTFQRRCGLPETGRVDGRTWAHLQRTRMEARSATSPAQSTRERSGAVRTTERLLKAAGLNPGRVDGVFDANTAAAVRRFERRHNLRVDGKVDTRDLAALRRAASGDDRQARAQMQRLLDVARRGAQGQRPMGWCLREVQNYLDQVTYGKGKVPRLPYARNFAEYLNDGDNAARLGLKRLRISNPYDAPPGSIIVVRPGTPGTHHPTAGDIVVKGRGDSFYNDGEMGYGGRGNFPRGNNYVLGVYVPAGYRSR